MCVGRPPWQPTEWVVKGGGEGKKEKEEEKKAGEAQIFHPGSEAQAASCIGLPGVSSSAHDEGQNARSHAR